MNDKRIIIVPITLEDIEIRREWLETYEEEDNYWDYPISELDYLMENLEDADRDEVIYGLYEGRLYEMPWEESNESC